MAGQAPARHARLLPEWNAGEEGLERCSDVGYVGLNRARLWYFSSRRSWARPYLSIHSARRRSRAGVRLNPDRVVLSQEPSRVTYCVGSDFSTAAARPV